MTYADFSPWDGRSGIDIIHPAGGIAVLAHPDCGNDDAMKTLEFLIHSREHLNTHTDWGLDGLKALTPTHSATEIDYYTQYTAELGLHTTTGSDCHGDDPFLGPGGMGRNIEIPLQSYERLLVSYHTNLCLCPA